ncbi:MAG: SIS domain-containing protein [Lachnospiraceae bacterium]|nr:SIS domain-containing protein [Lachnospiraceae bacterium]
MSACKESCQVYLDTVKTDLVSYIDGMDMGEIERAAQLIIEAGKRGNRLHISGIGKPGHIAGYISSLISSVGTPTYFLHGTEAVHGSCGQLMEGDIVIFISNSGETSEMKSTVLAIKNNGCQIIGVSGNPESWLAKESEVHLFAGVPKEGGPMNRAPRMSILAETLVLQTLSVYLQKYVDLSPQEYVKRHPGGSLGQLRAHEK